MATSRTVCCLVLTTILSLAAGQDALAIRVLMHGRESDPVFRDDGPTFELLESMFGAANVDYMQGSVAPADGSAVNGYDALYISSSMASSDTRDKYENSTVGIVCSENALIHDNNVGNFMLSDAGGNQDNITERQKINILDPAHPLAAGLSGEVTVYQSDVSNWWQFGTGDLGAGVDLIADMVLPESDPPPPAQHAIFAADIGAALRGDGSPGSPATAAGRRVFFFMSDFGSADLTDDGKKLFRTAIEWAAAKPSSADFDGDGDVDGGDFLNWQRGLGMTAAQRVHGDADGNGTVDAADLAAWKSTFGAAPAAVAAVPEPASAVLVVLALSGGYALRRRRTE
jgi:hypothetical protein